MKNAWFRFSACIICALIFSSGIAQGQSVTINSVSGTNFCAGDSIAVTFTATGFWGHRNAFTLQLSDPNGSFSNFQNIASLADTLPGTFTIKMSTLAVALSMHYRFRILAAIPYIISADNGSDIAIQTSPAVYLGYPGPTGTSGTGSAGTPITFTAYVDNLNETGYWDFGSGATPTKATTPATEIVDPNCICNDDTGISVSQVVTYSTPGDKTVTLTVIRPGACSTTTVTSEVHIYDCSNPSIPHDAIVVNSDTTIYLGPLEPSMTYWVNPGVSLNLPWGSGHDSIFTIFAEPGSTISGAVYCMLYMKHGSVFSTSGGRNSVIFGDGTSINVASNNFTLNCPTLDFDYTNAPPNAAHPTESVKNDLNSVPITLSPNPTNGMLSVQGLPSDNITVSVYNVLGEMVTQQKNPPSSNLSLDLSKLVPGTYYVRFSSPNSVVTKKVIKD